MTSPLNTPPKPSQAIKSFQILVGAIIIGLIVFLGVMLLVIQFNGPVMPEGPDNINVIFFLVVAGLAVICLLFAFIFYHKKMNAIKGFAISLDDKLNQYRAILIIFMALCEGVGFFSIIVFFLTGDYMLLIITGVILAAML
ncbi:MAG TPA: hypothetical protein VN451_11665, partial [Chitinophagaceae bacterium]|nr:hypothetical protein [Chitinophagaceae bacterium]